jgi:hypothetical protein
MPGLDGQKMSKSYGNTITLREDAAAVTHKVRRMPTDPARIRRSDPGDPDKCPVWQLHQVYSDETCQAWVQQGCRSAGIGCLDCKQPVIDGILHEQAPMRERAQPYLDDPPGARDHCRRQRPGAPPRPRNDARRAPGDGTGLQLKPHSADPMSDLHPNSSGRPAPPPWPGSTANRWRRCRTTSTSRPMRWRSCSTPSRGRSTSCCT